MLNMSIPKAGFIQDSKRDPKDHRNCVYILKMECRIRDDSDAKIECERRSES